MQYPGAPCAPASLQGSSPVGAPPDRAAQTPGAPQLGRGGTNTLLANTAVAAGELWAETARHAPVEPLLVTSDGAAGCRGLGLRQGQPVPVGDVCPRALDGVALGFHLPHCPLWSRDRIRQCALSGPGDGCFGAGSLRRSAARSPVLSPCLGGCGGREGPAGGGAWVSSSLRTVSPRARAHPRSVIVSL
uniref:Uncharacterized protein n=1 Tax=Rousettus aegyptiacus TaxID=9407 RepID=A0A7J8EZL6_ROUAE|nr:hypothetical protein HJG63_012177 [Rousettus aegyptiacus]